MVDALTSGLPIAAKPLKAVSHHKVAEAEIFLHVSQLPTMLPCKEIILYDVSKTHVPRSRMPSKIFHSPYLIKFGTSEKGKDKMPSEIHQIYPFESFGICCGCPNEIITEYC